MPKTVRIENADSNDTGITIEVWRPGDKEDILVVSHQLPHPTAQVELPITKGGDYLVIRET